MSSSNFSGVPGSGPNLASSRSPLPFQREIQRVAMAAAAGAVGGFCGFLCGEPEAGALDRGHVGGAPMMLTPAVWMAVVGTIMGLCILTAGNLMGLTGKWYRNLGIAVPILMVGCGLSGGLAQAVYGTLRLVVALSVGESTPEIVLVRALGWAIMGIGVGAFLGVARFNRGQIVQGAVGGCIGGLLGGLAFDALGQLDRFGDGQISRGFGLILTGAFIAAGMSIVQQLFNSAWLLGVSTGPYEGKEYCLDTPTVTVGRGARNQIALFRDESLPDRLGQLVNRGGTWWWEGSPIAVDGAPLANGPIRSGSRLEFGTYAFKFSDRSLKGSPDPDPVSIPSQPADTSGGFFTLPARPAPGTVQTPPPVQPSVVPLPPAPAQPVQVSAPQPRLTPGPASQPAGGMGAMADRLVLQPVSGDWPRFALGRAASASLGRTPDNDWSLPDDAVSSSHAFFMARDGRLMVTDLDSTNGTTVNGERLKPREPVALHPGDRIRFGEVEYAVEVQ